MKYNAIWQRIFSAIGAILCAASVALSAYANHGLEAEFRERMLLAAYFAFAHGLSLLVLARISDGKYHLAACGLMFIGLLLFSGSLACAAVWHTPTTFAPAGGMVLMLAWCWTAVNVFRTEVEK